MTCLLPIICRFCMNSVSEVLLDIHKVDFEMNIILILNNLNFKINKDDGLPSSICRNCIEIIKKFYDFKQRCIESEKHLRIAIFSPNNPLTFNHITCTSKVDTSAESNQPKTIQTKKRYSICNKQREIQDNISTAPNQITSKKQIYKTSSNHQCEICGRIFKIKTGLESHLLTHSGLKPFTCKICQKQFTRNENLNIHMRSHLGIKPFICDICGKTSTKRQDLVRHLKIHSNDRNCVCTECSRKFKRSSDLVSHMRTHTGARPYSCIECHKSYTSHGGLRKHFKMHILEYET